MGFKAKWNRGEEVPRFEFRPGIGDFPEWDGIKREMADPGSIPANSVWTAINVRFNGVSFVSRPGQSPWNSVPQTGCIYGIFDFEGVDLGGVGGAVLVGGANVISAATQPYGPCRYDETAATPYFKYTNGDFSNTILQKCIANSDHASVLFCEETVITKIFSNRCFFKMNGKLYGLSDGYDYNSGTFTGTPGVYEVSVSPSVLSVRRVMDLPVRCTHVLAVNERDISTGSVDTVNDVAYLAGINNGNLYRWSLSTGFTTEATGGPNYRTVVAKYRENIYVASRDSLRVRNSVGSYSNIALPGFAAGKLHFFPFDAISYKDKLYIIGTTYNVGDPNNSLPVVLVYDGTSCTVARNLPAGAFGFFEANSGETAFGNLYVSYCTDSSTSLLAIAKFDGTTWTDLHANNIVDGSPYNGGGLNVLQYSRLRFNGKDMLINAVQNDNGAEGFSSPVIIKTAGSDFSTRTILASPGSTNPPAFGDMIIMDQS